MNFGSMRLTDTKFFMLRLFSKFPVHVFALITFNYEKKLKLSKDPKMA